MKTSRNRRKGDKSDDIVGSNPTPGIPTASPIQRDPILETILGMRRDGYKPTTIQTTVKKLRYLAKRVDLNNPVEVLNLIMSKSRNYQCVLIDVYRRYLKYNGIYYSLPRLKREIKPIWLPTEEMIDLLSSRIRGRIGMAVRLIKETGMRPEEVSTLKPRDFDFRQGRLYLQTAKYGNPRVLKISESLMAEIEDYIKRKKIGLDTPILPPIENLRRYYQISRNRLAERLRIPELKRISLYTLRHFKATHLYRKTRDILYVKEYMGHRSISSTLKYIHLSNTLDETGEYICKAARTVKQAKELIEQGFEYVCEIENVKLFKKLK